MLEERYPTENGTSIYGKKDLLMVTSYKERAVGNHGNMHVNTIYGKDS